MTRRVFPDSLCLRNFTSPVPRSFHSLESFAKRNTFARLHQSQRQRQISKETDEKDIVSGEDWGKVHFELDGLVFLVGGDGDFFQFNQRLKVYIRRLRSLFTLLSHINKLSKTRLEQWPIPHPSRPLCPPSWE
jgi:hypothetical protein